MSTQQDDDDDDGVAMLDTDTAADSALDLIPDPDSIYGASNSDEESGGSDIHTDEEDDGYDCCRIYCITLYFSTRLHLSRQA